jgi:hypothetical protein
MESLMIRNESGRIVPLKFSDSQEILWRYVAPALDNPQGRLWFIVLKGRQVYATTFFEALTFVRTTERPNSNSLIIAQGLEEAGEIFNMAKRFYDHIPLPKLKPSKVKELIFPFDKGQSKFRVVSAGTAAKGRGTTQTCVHCSEVAFWPHPEVMLGLFQSMPDLPDTLWVVESTANGMQDKGQLFYDQWKAAIGGDSKITPIFIPWYIMPKYKMDPAIPEDDWDDEEKILVRNFGKFGVDGRSLRWRRYAIATKCEGILEKFHQEYPSSPEEAFVSSGLPAFDSLAILDQQRYISPPIARGTMEKGKFENSPSGEIRVWKKPQDGHQYAIGVDCAEGIRGGDYTCAQVVDMESLEQVAVVHGLLQPYDFAKLLNDFGRWYNTAIINIEVKSSGWAVQDYMLRIFNYPRFHPWRGKPDRVGSFHVRLWGYDTNTYSRPLLIEAGRRAINKRLITIHDAATLMEIRQFSRQDSGIYEAEAGHDDRVLALLLALRSREENYVAKTSRKPWQDVNFTEPDTLGIRVLDVAEPDRLLVRHVHKAMQEQVKRAKKASKDWLNL